MFGWPETFGVIVVGGGHAGIEAALSSARMGCRTLLVTMDLDTIGKMSCNPAIGGLAKGHMVREIDALGGQMGITTDATGIQFRMLNRKKGPAVWAPRAQCDKRAYQFSMKTVCEGQRNLMLYQGQVVALVVEDECVVGVETLTEVRFIGKCVILTAGTFLRGLLHIGDQTHEGGRGGEPAAQRLSDCLEKLGFELKRLKTGTPPRISRRSLDMERLTQQWGDDPPPPFSFLHDASYSGADIGDSSGRLGQGLFHVEQSGMRPCCPDDGSIPVDVPWCPTFPQLPCYLTSTTVRTKQLIQSNLHRSPLYSGRIKGVGPRYCPSIEDKYVKFPDKATHPIFLEPEGIHTEEMYVNGCSTSLPYDLQVEVIRSIRGLEQAEILRPAYAVEYDFAPPTQLYPWLETKRIKNLFFAGQINGTTGYEEAAAQGFMAGVNAVLRVRGKEPFMSGRPQSYIGVLIDDLVTKGTEEPYRMFTSRAEYRLLLRQDNADARLTPLGYEWGLISSQRYARFQQKMRRIAELKESLRTTRHEGLTLEQWVRRPELDVDAVLKDAEKAIGAIPPDLVATVEMDIKYETYVQRDLQQVERLRNIEDQRISSTFDYLSVRALRKETREKLHAVRPQTLGQASRISGVTPADIGVLMVWLKRHTSK
jgi:tRNA uridine 5-carboxymethylaminomethyl modification enzyme